MSLEDLYANELEQGVRNALPVFGPQSEAPHSWADLAKAPFEGGAAGVLEAAATWAPFLRSPGPMLKGGGAQPDLGRIQQQLAQSPEDQQAEARTLAKDVMPDAQTASTAAQAVAGFANFGVKAGAYVGTGGTLGAVPLAADLYSTAKARLMGQGVDEATASQAAWQEAGVGAASVLIPMGAATRLGRFAIGTAVGEGGNIAQQASEKFILDHSGYHEQAAQFDPFDPVSLAVGAVPGVLGAALPHGPARPALPAVVQHLESAGQRFGPDGQLLQGPLTASGERAQGDMQVMPKTMTDPGFGVRPADLSGTPEQQAAEIARVGDDYITALRAHFGDDAKALAAYNWGPGHLEALLKAHPEDWQAHLPAETQSYVQRGLGLLGGPDRATVDAVRVSQTAAAMDDSRLTPPEDLAGRDLHQQALETAFDQMARGDPVAVPFGDRLLGLPETDEARSAADRVQALEDERAALLGDASQELGPGEPSALHQQLAELESQAPNTSTVAIKARAQELQGPGVSYKKALGQAQREAAAAAAEHAQSVQRLQDQLQQHASAAQARERIDVIDQQLQAERATQAAAGVPSAPTRLATAMRGAFDEMRARATETPAQRRARVISLADAVRQLGELRAPAEPAPKANHAAFHEAETQASTPGTIRVAGETNGSAGETPAASRETSPLDAAIEQIGRDHPELMVHMDGMTEPMRATDLLQQLREEAAQTGNDSKLLEVAAACAVRN